MKKISGQEIKLVTLREFAKDKDGKEITDGDSKLSLIDIKAAIAEQDIPISELFSKQDIAANRDVMGLVHDAESKIKAKLEKEIIIMQKDNKDLRAFKDKADVVSLVNASKVLIDKPAKTVEYIKARLQTGRGVDLSGNLTDIDRQDKVNEAIQEELDLIESQGITFKSTEETDEVATGEDLFDDEKYVGQKKDDMTKAENNPLIPK